MTDLRKAAEMSIEAIMDGDVKDKAAAVYALRQALAQPEQKSFDRLIRIMGTFDLATGHADTFDELLDSLESELRDVLGHLRTRREWVGLTINEVLNLLPCSEWKADVTLIFAKAIEAKLKEKNIG